MSQTQLSFWLNTDVKEQFEAVCDRIGMTSAEVFEGFATIVCREKRLPFDIAETFESDEHLFYSEKNIAELTRRAQELDAGLGVVHELIEVNE